jgi:tyrosyl-tRNA synthetase
MQKSGNLRTKTLNFERKDQMKPLNEQLEAIKRGVTDIITQEELTAKLKRSINENKPLRVKFGIDPTAPDVHLGFTVPLRKLKTFQELGHKVVIIIGSYTAMVGDPSGRNATRPQLTFEQVMASAKFYQEQIFKILDSKRTEIVYNGDWFSKFSFNDVIKLASGITVASLLEHDYFRERYDKGIPISLHEFMYPLMQGYDSVVVKADIELGGTDQRFNIIVGRGLQKEAGEEPQAGLFLPILTGTDGKAKMSKSLGNYVGINEPAKDMFGKIMSIPDEIMPDYFKLLTDIPLKEIDGLFVGLKDGSIHPKEVKRKLAEEIVRMYHNDEAAKKESAEFDRVFRDKEMPEDIPEISMSKLEIKDGKIWVIKLLLTAGIVSSKNEAIRLFEQGGVTVNGNKITGADIEAVENTIIKAGKRRYIKLVK